MRLKVLGSSSKGNCYLLENESECLVIEAGLPFKEVKVALDFNVSKIVGVLVTHEHGDHARYIHQYERVGIPIMKPYVNADDKKGKVGNFAFSTFPLVHDVPCYGFLIYHPEMGKLIYVTDTEYCKYTFKNSNVRTFLVEANYDSEIMDENASCSKKDHVYLGHMSIDTTCEFLKHSMNEHTKRVILCHLSASNGDSEGFCNKVDNLCLKSLQSQTEPCRAAEKGMVVEL